MRKIFKPIIIIIILLSILSMNWNFGLNARNFDDEKTTNSTPRSNNHPRVGGFNWGPIEVISEPIPNQDNNFNCSTEPTITIEEN